MTTCVSTAAATGLPQPIPSLADPLPRRGFLCGLAKLPLVGGSLALLGQPTAVAEPITLDLMEAYKTWLDYELRLLTWEMADDPMVLQQYSGLRGVESRLQRSDEIGRHLTFVGKSGSYHHLHRPGPSTRAALVLSAVGCSWDDGDVTFAAQEA